MITAIVFSKNRALQLDLTLQSIRKNLPQVEKIFVIYKADAEYDMSYSLLQADYINVVFEKQDGYLLDAILKHKASFGKFIAFFTDDNIVYRPCNMTLGHLDCFYEHKQTCCLSLRLGYNAQMRDYGTGTLEPDIMPQYEFFRDTFLWNRLSIPPGGYWSYPLSVDGHIFRTKDMITILETMRNWPEMFSSLQTPNKFEAMLQRFFFEIPPMMMCLKYSTVVNSPNNRVQSEYGNASGLTYSYEAKFLNDLFMAGRRIDINALSIKNIVCPHQEIDLLSGII